MTRPPFPRIKTLPNTDVISDFDLGKIIGFNEAVKEAFAWATYKEESKVLEAKQSE